MASYIIGIGSVVFLMIAWIAVQFLWRRVFADHVTDEDALAGRTSCGNCGCTTVCSKHTTGITDKKDSTKK